jgi:hypothetical protein
MPGWSFEPSDPRTRTNEEEAMSGEVVAPSACGAEVTRRRQIESTRGLRGVRRTAMHTIYHAEERLGYAELRRIRNLALRRSRVRSTMRRAIEEGLRYGIEPHEVEREFTMTLQQVTNR